MSFSSDLRAEIARIIPSSRRDRDTAIAVLIANLCTFGTADDGCVQMYFSSGNLPAVRKCFTLIQKNVNIRPDLLTPKLSGEDRDPEKRKTGAGRADHDVQASAPEDFADFQLFPFRRDGRRKPCSYEVLGMAADRVHALVGDVLPVRLREPEPRAELRLRKPQERRVRRRDGFTSVHGRASSLIGCLPISSPAVASGRVYYSISLLLRE